MTVVEKVSTEMVAHQYGYDSWARTIKRVKCVCATCARVSVLVLGCSENNGRCMFCVLKHNFIVVF